MIDTILDAIESILEDQGEPTSPYWLASMMMECRLWRADERKVRNALEKDLRARGDDSRFVKIGEDEWALRSWKLT